MKGGGRLTCPAAGEDAEEDRGPAAEGEKGGCWEGKGETTLVVSIRRTRGPYLPRARL